MTCKALHHLVRAPLDGSIWGLVVNNWTGIMIGTTNSNYHASLSFHVAFAVFAAAAGGFAVHFPFPCEWRRGVLLQRNGRHVKHLSSTTTVIAIITMCTMIGLELHYLQLHPKKYPLRNAAIPLRYWLGLQRIVDLPPPRRLGSKSEPN